MSKRNLIVVLGMHRSGTSAITKSLNLLGISLGSNLHPSADDNPTGFWEDAECIEINESLLRTLGSAYDKLDFAWENIQSTPEIEALKSRAINLIKTRIDENGGSWAFKDPRTCRLLTFWQEAFNEAACNTSYIIAIRNPISVVKSLNKRNALAAEKSYILWLQHTIPCILQTATANTVVVDYDNIMENPYSQVRRISKALNISAPASDSAEVRSFERDFLKEDLRHTRHSIDELLDETRVPSAVSLAYRTIKDIADDKAEIDPSCMQTFATLDKNLRGMSAPLRYIDKIQQNLSQEISRLENVAIEKDIAIKSQAAEIRMLHEELSVVKASRLYRLMLTQRSMPWGFKKVFNLTKIILGGLTPQPISAYLKKKINSERTADKSLISNTSSAYVVKQPELIDSDSPIVVHIIANFMTGGSSRLVVDLVEHLGHQYKHFVLTSLNPTPPAYVGLDIEECRFPADTTPFKEYYQRIRPDFIHVHYWGDCDEPWYAKAILAAEELGIAAIENINTPIAPYLSKAVYKYIYVSKYVKKTFSDGQSKDITIYPGSNFELFHRASDEQSPENCVGMVYRLERDKLNEESIIPFIRIAQLRPTTKILIVGGGSLLEVYKLAVQQAGVSDNFEFTGYVEYDALPDLYRKMSLFIAPVWKESFGQVSPFAMSMKVPVIGYDIGAISEIIDSSELVAPFNDADGLARIAIRLLDSPSERQRLGETQQVRAQGNFSIQAMIENYSNVYREVVTYTHKDSM